MNYQDKVDLFEEFFRDVYEEKLARAISLGMESLLVDFNDLEKFNYELADELLNSAEETLRSAMEALKRISITENKEIFPRFCNLGDENKIRIKDLRSKHLGKLICVEGIIKRASEVRPEVISAVFECMACGNTIEKEQRSSQLRGPYECNCGSRKFEVIDKKMTDVQIINVEESPETLEGSEQPSRISIYLRGDLVDPNFQKRVMPGNKVSIIGILKEAPSKFNSKRYDIFVEGNYIESIEREFEEIEITPEEEKKILEMSKREDILDLIVDSIAPSIYGHREIKKAIALQLLGGVRKERPDNVVTRGDIHILLIGEPGTGKSALLKFASKLAPKGRYVVGKGATATGITATVVRDEMSGGFALEAGALVLANKGLAAIDEIDKMSSEDRSALHEALEQQSITISKANIHATLNARTAVLAAGNPKFGRFDPYRPIAQQINISETLLSRFDLIFTVRDIPNREKDKELTEHIIRMHQIPEKSKGKLDNDFIRKYIAYAKRNVSPVLSEEAGEEIRNFYLNIRNKKSYREEGEVSVPISARQLEALIRLSEASAKCRLSDKVERKDALLAIELLTHCLREVGVDPETGEFDIDRIEVGITGSQRNKIRVVMDLISQMSGEGEPIPVEDVIAAAEEKGILDAGEIINKLKKEGELFEPRHGFIQKI